MRTSGRLIFRRANVFMGGRVSICDVSVRGDVIEDVSPSLLRADGDISIPADGQFLLPGFADVHVHLREPGFSYKETIRTGTLAAAAGGYTAVCAMPNLSPAPDSPETLRPELALIERDACVRVYPYGCLTEGRRGAEPSDMSGLAPLVAGFSDDGSGIQDEVLMRRLMELAASLDKPIAAHCEVNALLHGGCIHDGRYAAAYGYAGIPSESEWQMIERDISLARETGCRYHVCHVSTAEGVELVRRAKAEGLSVTCETAPHYLLLCEDDLEEDGRFKMNPPVRTAADREALRRGLCDGTIDCVATDHAPHAAEEKARGLEESAMGIVGLETAFPLLWTELVRPGLLPAARLLDALIAAPRRIFRLPGGELAAGAPADLTLWDMDAAHRIDPERFLSLGRATPFAGREAVCRCLLTLVGGKAAFGDIASLAADTVG